MDVKRRRQAVSGRAVGAVRRRRGVPFMGEKRDVQEVLQIYLDRGYELEMTFTRARTALVSMAPELYLLSRNTAVPQIARDAAANEMRTLQFFTELLSTILVDLGAWQGMVQGALDQAHMRGIHTPVEPRVGLTDLFPSGSLAAMDAEWRRLNRPDHWGVRAVDLTREFLDTMRTYRLQRPDAACPVGGHHIDRGSGPGGSAGPSAGPSAGASAIADPLGVPEAVQSHATAYYAGADTLARLFAYAKPVANNTHHRRYTFTNKSYVDFQAYQPQLTTSSASDWAVVLAGLLGAGVGVAVVGRAGPVGAVAGGVVGGITGITMAATLRRHDFAWQPYRADCYSAAGESIWGQRYFYGWRQSPSVTQRVRLGGSSDPAKLYNFADYYADFSWSRWHHGWGEERPAAADPCAVALQDSVARLIQGTAALAGAQGLGGSGNDGPPPAQAIAALLGSSGGV